MSLKKIRGNWTNGGVVGIKKIYCRWTVFKSNFLKKLTNPAKTWLGTWEVLLNPSVCWRGIRSLSSSRRPPFHCLKKGNGEKAEVCQIRQELDWTSVETGLTDSQIQIWNFWFRSSPLMFTCVPVNCCIYFTFSENIKKFPVICVVISQGCFIYLFSFSHLKKFIFLFFSWD